MLYKDIPFCLKYANNIVCRLSLDKIDNTGIEKHVEFIWNWGLDNTPNSVNFSTGLPSV